MADQDQPKALPPKPTTPTKAGKKNATEKKTKGRSGAPNYSAVDVTALLDIVERVEPIGANMWAAVAADFDEWSTNNVRPKRDADSLKNKFDKLCNARKPTGDPSCPSDVRRAKHIARNIQGTIGAKLLAEEEEGNSNGREEKEDDVEAVVGGSTAQEKRKPVKQFGLHAKKAKTEEVISNSMESMTQFMGVIANSFSSGKREAVSKDEQEALIASVVKKEVKEWKEELDRSMKDTKEILVGMNIALKEIMGSMAEDASKSNVQ